MTGKIHLYLILVFLYNNIRTIKSDVYYIIPSQSPSNQCITESDRCLTLSQFVHNSSNYLTNDTIMIFVPENHILEAELVIEHIQSFSMLVQPTWLKFTKAVIVCNHNARFEFRNASIVTLSGLDFDGCFENGVISVGHFQLKNSKFSGQKIVNGSVLIIDHSAATLDTLEVMFPLDLWKHKHLKKYQVE